jgi:hypothetical protein
VGARVARSDWAAVAESSAGWVRQLEAGDGRMQAPSAPDDWHDELLGGLGAQEAAAPARQEVGPAEARATDRAASVRHKVQFTVDQAYVELLEQARALLWHRLPNGDLAQLHRLALEALVEKLVRRKYGAAARSKMVEERARSAAADSANDEAASVEAPAAPTEGESAVVTEASNVIGPEAVTGTRPAADPSGTTASALERSGAPSNDAQLGPNPEHPATSHSNASRHVPAAVRSAVWLRDEARCTFVDARGVRCRATTVLELHHERPFARGGPATAENIRLRCHAHNDLAAEQDFGRELMLARKRGSDVTRHAER